VSYNHSPLFPPAPLLVCWPSNTFFSTSNVRITSWFPYCFQRIYFFFFFRVNCCTEKSIHDISIHVVAICVCIQVCSMSGGLSAD
jgi:1-acyl-sn-glycerol-3-phosphate acyltransferase